MGPWTVKESAVTSVFRANNFYYPVEVTTEVSPPLTSFPWIKPSNFLGAMSKMNDLDHLLGGLSLKESRGRLVKFLGEIPTAVPTASAVATSWFWSERNSILHTSPTAWRRRSHLQEEWTISFEFSGSYWTWMWQASCTWQLESTVRWSSIKLFADWIPDTPAHLCVSEGPFSCGVSIQLVASFLIYIVVRDHARFGC